MEALTNIQKFLFIQQTDGCGEGWGSGSGWGSGCGEGWGSGSGSGCGEGWGSGSGSGCGEGWGSGCGEGWGSGSGDGIKSVNHHPIFFVDGIPTVFYKIRGNIAKCGILQQDLSFEPCFVVKGGNLFAHGATLREAQEALQEKLFEELPEEERIRLFVESHEDGKTYSNQDFFEWHNKLTGSCLMGREQFAREHEVDLDASMTVQEFIKLTENAYGGSTIRKLKEFYS